MIRNVVLAKLKTGYDAAEVEQIQDGLRNLDCPGTRHYTVGTDAGLRDGNWDFVIVADFEDTAAYRATTRMPSTTSCAPDWRRSSTRWRGPSSSFPIPDPSLPTPPRGYGVWPYFENVDVKRLKGNQRSFIAAAIGGPEPYLRASDARSPRALRHPARAFRPGGRSSGGDAEWARRSRRHHRSDRSHSGAAQGRDRPGLLGARRLTARANPDFSSEVVALELCGGMGWELGSAVVGGRGGGVVPCRRVGGLSQASGPFVIVRSGGEGGSI